MRIEQPQYKLSRKAKALQDLNLQLKALDLPEFETEIVFHPTRRWRIDYGYSALKIGVEFEGGIFAIGKPCKVCKRPPLGRHSRGASLEADAEKYAEANLLGWIIIKATENLIRKGSTVDLVSRAYQKRIKQFLDRAERDQRT